MNGLLLFRSTVRFATGAGAGSRSDTNSIRYATFLTMSPQTIAAASLISKVWSRFFQCLEEIFPRFGKPFVAHGFLLFNRFMSCPVEPAFFQSLENRNRYFPSIGKYWEMDFCRIYVDTPVGKIGIYQEEGSTNGATEVSRSYIHKDHLGSVI